MISKKGEGSPNRPLKLMIRLKREKAINWVTKITGENNLRQVQRMIQKDQLVQILLQRDFRWMPRLTRLKRTIWWRKMRTRWEIGRKSKLKARIRNRRKAVLRLWCSKRKSMLKKGRVVKTMKALWRKNRALSTMRTLSGSGGIWTRSCRMRGISTGMTRSSSWKTRRHRGLPMIRKRLPARGKRRWLALG